MCRKVIWAQVLKVGVSLRAAREVSDEMEARDGAVDDQLSNHHPVPTPKSSPSLVLGTSTFFSWACGMV